MAAEGNLEIMMQLCQAVVSWLVPLVPLVVDVNAANSKSYTVLPYAASKAHVNVMQLLPQHDGIVLTRGQGRVIHAVCRAGTRWLCSWCTRCAETPCSL